MLRLNLQTWSNAGFARLLTPVCRAEKSDGWNRESVDLAGQHKARVCHRSKQEGLGVVAPRDN